MVSNLGHTAAKSLLILEILLLASINVSRRRS